MNVNQIDILITIFVIFIIAIGFNNGMIKNICKIINLSSASILSSLIITNLSIQFPILNKTQDVLFLSIFFLIFMALLFLIGFIIEFIIEQVENVEIDKYLEIAMNIVAGAVKGFVLVALLLFIFDTVPMSYKTKDLINNKIGKNSLLFKPCSNLKNILFNR